MKNKKLELLAPAQNLETGLAAITCGADAVYIGAKSFGARKAAGNELFDIKKLIDFAHLYNAKIYVTVNTILDDKEIYEAEKLINDLYNIGADALIIQDMGLLELNLPPIELHASTQCNIRTKEKVKFFEEIGIKRAILARELSVRQIEDIHKYSDIELEAFIHGALCVSYSGQCYLSAYVGGRSANRGECAQACRRKYSLIDNEGKTIVKDKYLLSLKDFCAEKYLDKLVQAGVTSFKIEGRLKDENYVKNTVLYYRNLLDKYQKTSDGTIISDFKPDINKTFNRGYTTYFLGDNDEIFNFQTPKSMGEYLGEVSFACKNYFEIKNNPRVVPQDGLCFIKKEGLEGFLINKVDENKIYPNKELKINIGDKIYRNKNVEFENILKNSKTKRVIKVDVAIYNNKISVFDGKNTVEMSYKTKEPAKNQEKMRENFEKSFSKSGDSIFELNNIEFKTNSLGFLPVSKINDLRRQLFKNLELERLKNYKRNNFKKTTYAPYNDFYKDYRLNIHNKLSETFYKNCGVQNIEKSLESTKNYSNKELMRTKHCIRRALNMCLKTYKNKKELFLADEDSKKYILNFDCKNCEMVIKPLK